MLKIRGKNILGGIGLCNIGSRDQTRRILVPNKEPISWLTRPTKNLEARVVITWNWHLGMWSWNKLRCLGIEFEARVSCFLGFLFFLVFMDPLFMLCLCHSILSSLSMWLLCFIWLWDVHSVACIPLSYNCFFFVSISNPHFTLKDGNLSILHITVTCGLLTKSYTVTIHPKCSLSYSVLQIPPTMLILPIKCFNPYLLPLKYNHN